MYVKVRNLCGIFAVVVSVAYVTALEIAACDGPGGVEVPFDIRGVIIAAIVILGVVAVASWITEQTFRALVDKEVRSVVAAEVEKAFDEHAGQLRTMLNEIARQTRAVSVAEFRALLQDEIGDRIREEIQTGLQTAQRYGMVREARGRAAVGETTKAIVTPLYSADRDN